MDAPTTIATYLYPWEAEIARGLLESEGIPAKLADENIVRMDWTHSLAVGGVRLTVPAQSVAEARAVLQRQRNGEFEATLEQEHNLAPAACAQCGSREFNSVYSPLWIALLVVSFGLAAIFPPPAKALKCRQCGGVVREAL